LQGLEQIYGPEHICVLTSPVDTPGAVEGKVDWIRHNMPDYRRRFFVGPPKHLVAASHIRLVDDHDDNVDAFVAAGGRATLVPRPWNRRINETNNLGRFDPELLLQEVAAARESR
jgi:5'(3')-deoxyribonucleotidase